MPTAKKTKTTAKKKTKKTPAKMTKKTVKKTTKKAVKSKQAGSDNTDVQNSPLEVKKTVRKKAIAAKPMSIKDLDYFRQLLLEKRAELVGDVDAMNGDALNGNRQDSTGELSNMPIHMADVGTDNYEQEFTLGLIESERKLLHDIDDALAKINDGTYGICEGTDEPISRARLEAKPEARYSIEYAKMIEKGLVRVSGEVDDEEDDEDSQKKLA